MQGCKLVSLHISAMWVRQVFFAPCVTFCTTSQALPVRPTTCVAASPGGATWCKSTEVSSRFTAKTVLPSSTCASVNFHHCHTAATCNKDAMGHEKLSLLAHKWDGGRCMVPLLHTTLQGWSHFGYSISPTFFQPQASHTSPSTLLRLLDIAKRPHTSADSSPV